MILLLVSGVLSLLMATTAALLTLASSEPVAAHNALLHHQARAGAESCTEQGYFEVANHTGNTEGDVMLPASVCHYSIIEVSPGVYAATGRGFAPADVARAARAVVVATISRDAGGRWQQTGYREEAGP